MKPAKYCPDTDHGLRMWQSGLRAVARSWTMQIIDIELSCTPAKVFWGSSWIELLLHSGKMGATNRRETKGGGPPERDSSKDVNNWGDKRAGTRSGRSVLVQVRDGKLVNSQTGQCLLGDGWGLGHPKGSQSTTKDMCFPLGPCQPRCVSLNMGGSKEAALSFWLLGFRGSFPFGHELGCSLGLRGFDPWPFDQLTFHESVAARKSQAVLGTELGGT